MLQTALICVSCKYHKYASRRENAIMHTQTDLIQPTDQPTDRPTDQLIEKRRLKIRRKEKKI